MNKYVKEFLKRGLLFGGFGCIIVGIVLWCIQLSGETIALDGGEGLLAIVSGYALAFVQAGASVFNQIENWPIAKSVGLHFGSIYTVYVLCYFINRWLPFRWGMVAMFTAIFVAVYAVVWVTVYLSTRKISRKLNEKIG